MATIIAAGTILSSCGSALDLSSVPDATSVDIVRVEPLSWWTGMKMPLQVMVQGKDISNFKVTVEGNPGVVAKAIRKADNPDFVFIDVQISSSAQPGTCWFVFDDGTRSFKYPYEIAQRRQGSASRKSFTTADMIYLIFPDRFANGDPSNDTMPQTAEALDRQAYDGRHGGDIQGIIDRLDYISELGATAIWSTPLLLDNEPQGSYHGYACGDYYHIDPRFGTNELYRELVAKAHEKGLKVIMDMVTNHCGTAHWWMKDMPFKDWVHIFPEYTGTNVAFSTNMDPNASAYDLNLQESGWFVPSMPDMNLDNPFVLRYFQQWAIWWAEYADLDGFRVDTYPYNEKNPMSEWCSAVMAEYPDFNIVGECWTPSYAQLAYWQGGSANRDGFDSHLPSIMDFPLYEAIIAALCQNGDNPGWLQGTQKIYDCLSHDFVYHDLSRMMIFVANHDTPRLGDTFNHDPRKLRMAMSLVATMRGIPQIYNGDEMMFSCRPGSWSDGAKRIDFPGGWEGDEADLFTAEGRAKAGKTSTADYSTAAELHDFTARLFNWRKGCDVIHNGRTMHFMTRDNTYAYFRYNETDAVFVYLNNTDRDAAIPWNTYAELVPERVSGTDVLTGKPVELSSGTVVPGMTALIVEFKR